MVIDKALLDGLSMQAKNSPRLRVAMDLRTTPEDNSQRILNAMEPGTVLPIHRHRGSTETVAVLCGAIRNYLYDDDGKVIESYEVRPDSDVVGFSIPVGVWHRAECIEPNTVILECKDGKYEPLSEEDVMK